MSDAQGDNPKAPEYRSTVVIPVFNTGEELIEAIDSVLSQSKGRDEIVLVNDGSTLKATLDLLADYDGKPGIKVLHHERNKCLGAARNTGIRNASADIIVLLDADDKLVPEYLDRMLAPFSDPDVAFTYCDIQCFGTSDELWTHGPFDVVKLLEYRQIGGCSPFRKSVHEAVGGYYEKPRNEDRDFWINVCKHGYKGIYLPGGMYLYRRHDKALSTATPRTFAVAVQERIFNRHSEYITKHMSKAQFMSWAYHTAALAHLRTNEPFTSIGYALRLLVIPGKRMVGIMLLLVITKYLARRLTRSGRE